MFAENIIFVEIGSHQLVLGDVVPIVTLIPLCLDVAYKFSIRGNLVCLEEVYHQIIYTLTPFLQTVQVYLDLLIEVLNIGVDG